MRSTRPGPKLRTVIARRYDLYLLSIPGLLFLVIFRYVPIYGVVIAFKEYNIYEGIGPSPWVGLANFRELFATAKFAEVFRNTLLISVYKLLFQFPTPIILAILINEVANRTFKRVTQTIFYLPHFISWVVISGIFFDLLSPNHGIVNSIITRLGGEPIFFLAEKRMFRGILVFTHVWKEVGYGAIIYLAAIVGINPELYEAAIVDGAGRFRRTLHITLPGIKSTIVAILIIRMGYLLEVGHEQVLMMLNPAVLSVGDVISTYVYRVGLGMFEFSVTAAAGFIRNLIGLILVVAANYAARSTGEQGIW